jgi:hypothetical protein
LLLSVAQRSLSSDIYRVGFGWPVAQRRVRADGVEVDAPKLGRHTNLLHRVEDLAVQELIAQLRVETLAVAALPWRTGLDVERLCADVV